MPRIFCTIGFLDKIVDSGVAVLKDEGRGRSADYVDTVVRCYKEAVLALRDDTYTQDKIERWTEQLATVYNRGFWDGYYLGRKMGEWNDSYGSKATEKKIFLGKGVKYFSKSKVAEFRMESHTLNKGDSILITGPHIGVVTTEVKEMRVDDHSVGFVKKGDLFTIEMNEVIKPSCKLYKIVRA